MITEAILNILIMPIDIIFNQFSYTLPILTVPTSFLGGLTLLISYVAWILPLTELMPLFIFRIGLEIFNIFFKIIIRLKSFIPTMGG